MVCMPFILSARLSYFRIWTEIGDEGEKEKEKGQKGLANLVEARGEVQDIRLLSPTKTTTKKGEGGLNCRNGLIRLLLC